jgi:hypothetical protein
MPGWATARKIGAMSNDLIDIELLSDNASIAALSNMVRAQGGMLICHGCHDVSEVIAGILIIRDSEEAWALCGPCLQQVPLEGRLAS